ncbi:MAG: ParA family protein [Planctomycetes bacterium]|nr:ParA family protein [Planctomycetota bacterium]NOG55336.1 ParA family protein [Planctomycetota bacterium]
MHSAKHLSIFNHKGGVGKTTITVNVSMSLAKRRRRVLLVDSDPQCNLTAYLLKDDTVDRLLDKSDSPNGETLWSAVRPVVNGIGPPKLVQPQKIRQDVYLIPGDIRMTEFEEFLFDSWTDCFKRRIGAIQATSCISQVVEAAAEELGADYVFYDTGPNIGALNRVLLLDSDHFIIPVACDLFSARALRTLGQTLRTWIIDWETITTIAPAGALLLPGKPHFLGYIPQRFKTYGREMGAIPRQFLRNIQRRMYSDIMRELREVDESLSGDNVANCLLEQVMEYGRIVTVAQKKGKPISEIRSVNEDHRLDASTTFSTMADNIARLAGGTLGTGKVARPSKSLRSKKVSGRGRGRSRGR